MDTLLKDVLEKGQYNINKNKIFGNLCEDDEIFITREIINYVLWSNENIEIIKELLLKDNIELYKNNTINTKVLVEFWLQVVGKGERLEKILENIDVIADIHQYVKKYYAKILLFNSHYDIQMVSYSRFRTQEQYNTLTDIMKNSYAANSINKFFKEYKYDLDHIDSKNANMLISKFSTVIK